MTTIFCTNKLANYLGANNLTQIATTGTIGNWNANIFHVNRRKWIFMINDKTCYSIIIPNILKKHLKNFDQLFSYRLIEQLNYDGISLNKTAENEILNDTLFFCKTNNNRPIIGTMTQFIKDLNYYLCYHHEEMTLPELNNRLTNNLVTAFAKNKNDMHNPLDLMRLQISEMEGSV